MKEYNKANIPLAKTLRKNMTPWERKLWYEFLRYYPIRFQRQKSIGNYIVDLQSDMAAEERARATYENLMNETNDPDLLGPLSFLRQREVVHYNRFKELLDFYKNGQ